MAQYTLTRFITDLCGRQGLPTPVGGISGGNDPQLLQMMRLLEEEGDDLVTRHPWQVLTYEVGLTTVADEDQGDINDICNAAVSGQSFAYFKNGTFWDRANHLPVCGPLDAAEWQQMKALVSTGPRYRWRLRGNHLLINPTPTAGQTWYFEVVSPLWIKNSVVLKNRFTADSDVVVYPNYLCEMGLRWRWKKEKGLDYAEDFRTYEAQLAKEIGADGGKRSLHADCDPNRGPVPGIWVTPYDSVP